MSSLNVVPEHRRPAAAAALSVAFGDAAFALEPVLGGASGALAFRVDVRGERYLMRLEGPRTALRNPHQYACMKLAAEAGVAPPLVHVDEAAGVAITRFLAQRPLAEFPGGPAGLAAAAGALIARLQATPAFPVFRDYFDTIGQILEHMRGSGRFAPGLLDAHAAGWARIRAGYRPGEGVSSHNDPNGMNLLFDGERLWLVDWETAYRNDPLTDVAILANNLAPTPELADTLLAGWLGRAPDDRVRVRLVVMRQVVRLYYGCLIFMVLGEPDGPITDLAALTPVEFQAAVAEGRMAIGGADMMRELGKMSLADFRAGLDDPAFETALAAVA